MNEHEQWCLDAMAMIREQHGKDMYSGFDRIILSLGNELDRATVRRSVRSLARRGFAQYAKGLWTEDGEPAGAGYVITDLGMQHATPIGEPTYPEEWMKQEPA